MSVNDQHVTLVKTTFHLFLIVFLAKHPVCSVRWCVVCVRQCCGKFSNMPQTGGEDADYFLRPWVIFSQVSLSVGLGLRTSRWVGWCVWRSAGADGRPQTAYGVCHSVHCCLLCFVFFTCFTNHRYTTLCEVTKSADASLRSKWYKIALPSQVALWILTGSSEQAANRQLNKWVIRGGKLLKLLCWGPQRNINMLKPGK